MYHRAGRLVQVIDQVADSPAGACVRRVAGAVVIRDLPPPTLRDRLARSADYFRVVQTQGGQTCVSCCPPAWAVAAVEAAGSRPAVRRLAAVVPHPVVLADGTILSASGYHAETGLLVRPPAGLRVSVPENPTAADVAAAVETLLDVVCDFPFPRPAHRAAWLAGLLTPLSWFAFAGPAPFFLIDGNAAGCGKGLLADVIGLTVTGARFPVMTYSADEDEMRKRITSLSVEGERAVLLDNLAGPVGGATFDAALTGGVWRDRLLGRNQSFVGPLDVVWYGTANNAELRADIGRRTCHIRIETAAERPGEATGFKYPDLRGHVRARRGVLLSAALTILRGYIRARSTAAGLPAWGSFEGWSGLPRAAVVWAGLPDPGDTRAELRTRTDRTNAVLAEVLTQMARLDPTRVGMTAAQWIDRAALDPDARAAFLDFTPKFDAHALGCRLRSFARMPAGGLFLDVAKATNKGRRWAVYPIREFDRTRPDPAPTSLFGGDGGDRADAVGRSGGLPD